MSQPNVLMPPAVTPKYVVKRVNRSIICSGLCWISAIFVFTYTMLLASGSYAGTYTGAWFQDWLLKEYSTAQLVFLIAFPIVFALGTCSNVTLRKHLQEYAHTEVTILLLKIVFAINLIVLTVWAACTLLYLYLALQPAVPSP